MEWCQTAVKVKGSNQKVITKNIENKCKKKINDTVWNGDHVH